MNGRITSNTVSLQESSLHGMFCEDMRFQVATLVRSVRTVRAREGLLSRVNPVVLAKVIFLLELPEAYGATVI